MCAPARNSRSPPETGPPGRINPHRELVKPRFALARQREAARRSRTGIHRATRFYDFTAPSAPLQAALAGRARKTNAASEDDDDVSAQVNAWSRRDVISDKGQGGDLAACVSSGRIKILGASERVYSMRRAGSRSRIGISESAPILGEARIEKRDSRKESDLANFQRATKRGGKAAISRDNN
jgi:hypothetical protein